MKYRLLPLIFLALLPLAADETREDAKRTCRILYPDKPAQAIKEAYLFDGTNSQKVVLPSMNFSEVIELPGGEIKLALVRDARDAEDAFSESAPTVELPESVTDFLLLLNSDPDNQAMPVSLTVIDVSNDRLKAGETLWINYTAHPISAELGQQSLNIPSMRRAISDPPLEKSGYYKAQFEYQPDGEGDLLPIMRKSWWFDASSKNLGFIVETEARLPKIFTIRDHRN